MRKYFNTNNSKEKGALLLELLVVISLLAIILSVGSQAMLVSMQSGKVSGERDVAVGLASEALEATRATAEEKWHNIYNLTKETQHYHATSTAPAGKWTLATGDEISALNNAIYTRYLTIDNVMRDATSRAIVTSGGEDDPSTQKVTVTVSWLNAEPVVISEYFFRWRNKACKQTDWSGSATPNGETPCTTGTIYDSISPAGTINTTGGSLMLQ